MKISAPFLKIMSLIVLSLVAFSAHAMKVKKSGELSLSTNFNAISNGVSSMLCDPSTLTSSWVA